MICRWAIGAAVVFLACAASAAESTLTERHAALSAELAGQLEALAAKCDELDLGPQAAQTRAWLAPRKAGRTVVFLADPTAGAMPEEKDTRVQQWQKKFWQLRRDYAAKVFDLASEAAGDQQGELALRLVYEVVHENPEHSEAQRILGLKKAVMRVPKVRLETKPHSKFGWRGSKHWSLDTAHFTIETSAGANECRDLGTELELLHDAWRQVFFPVWGENRLVAGRFASNDIELSEKRRFRVVLFADRKEYLAQLHAAGGAAAMSSGFYSDEQKVSLFFAGAGSKRSTRFHEVTHQLIQEYLAAPAGIAKDDSVWLVEAAALYMESLVLRDGSAFLGGYDAENLQYARFRARGGDFQMPLGQLSSLGRDALQEHRDIEKIYGQMGGLGQFFMEGRAAELRPAFLKTLKEVYQGKADAGSLAAACKTSYDALDREYFDFLDVTDEMIARTPLLPEIRTLLLRRTAVTDAGLAAFNRCSELERLDLSLTATGDAGVAAIPATKKLKTLFLEATKISNEALAHVAEFPELEELYLSGTQITDESITSLVRLKKLKLLDLGGCPLTDACLPSLGQLKQLESLDLTGTKISSEGQRGLRKALPKWKE